MVELQPSKLVVRVRFPSPAPLVKARFPRSVPVSAPFVPTRCNPSIRIISRSSAGRARDRCGTRGSTLMPKPSTLRLIEIAELLGVSKQRAQQIADKGGSRLRSPMTVADGCGIGGRSRRGRRSGAARSPGARGGRSGTPVIHAQVLSMRECNGRRPGAVAHRRSPRWSPPGDGHHQGMRSTYLTATACTPPSPVSQIAPRWYCSGSDG
jgi:hypothetical protein